MKDTLREECDASEDCLRDAFIQNVIIKGKFINFDLTNFDQRSWSTVSVMWVKPNPVKYVKKIGRNK